jgi:citrate lyase subunit beta/citryl-CoA lyase
MHGIAPITYLFVPATNTARIAKAFASGSHAVIADLEDAVDAADKDAARRQLSDWLISAPAGQAPWVRINAVDTPWFADDLDLLKKHRAALAGVMLSKTQSYADLQAVNCELPLMALIESARGLLALADICQHPRLVRLAFGSADLSRDLGCEDATDVLAPMRAQLVISSAAAGLLPPVDGVTFALDDPGRAQADAMHAARCGFGAKLCVHPAQLIPVLRGFAPTAVQCRWAENILAVAASGSGAQRLGGEMVDKPVIARAQAILERRDAIGTSVPQPKRFR